MRLKTAVGLAFVACPLVIEAQGAAHVDSLIVTDQTGQPVPFVNVSVKGGTSRVTNEDGVVLMHAPDDTLNLLVRRIGYDAYQGKTGRDANKGAFHVTIARSAQSLNKVVVRETMGELPLLRNGFYERMQEVQRGAPTGEFFTPEDLEARSMPKISNFLYASRFAKIGQATTVGQSATGHSGGYNGRVRAYIQGRGGCTMTVLVDGIVMHNMLGDTKDANGSTLKAFGDDRNTIDDTVNGQDVMAIEIYPSAATAPMSIASKVLGASCGIVAIWTGARR